jgi:sulfane dehydrogenase subunit SoxC
MNDKTSDRRRFLRQSAAWTGGLAAAATTGAARAQATPAEPLVLPAWTTEQGRPAASPYGQPSRFETQAIRRAAEGAQPAFPTAASSRTPLAQLFGSLTPNGLVFERHHAGVPDIDPAQHRLVVHGLVARPLSFTLDDLLRFPSVSRVHFLECAGNSGSEWRPARKLTVQSIHGLLSGCEWTGVPLAVLLQEAGVSRDARWLLAEGADASSMTRSVPIEKALDDALVVYAQNGEMLRPEQGYPVRLLLPGWEGNTSVKWLRRLKLGTAPWQSRQETSKYTDLLPDGTARQFSFVHDVKSVITSPSGGQTLRGLGRREITGLAWSGHGAVRRVDVSVDGGRQWREATLQGPVLDKALTRFALSWDWQGQPAVLQSRAIDRRGNVQPTRAQLIAARGTESGYHYNGIQSWQVLPSGEVFNVHA